MFGIARPFCVGLIRQKKRPLYINLFLRPKKMKKFSSRVRKLFIRQKSNDFDIFSTHAISKKEDAFCSSLNSEIRIDDNNKWPFLKRASGQKRRLIDIRTCLY